MGTLYQDAEYIWKTAIQAVLPDAAVAETLNSLSLPKDRITVIAVGKAAWRMAHTAKQILGARIQKGFLLTKYGHSEGALPGFEIVEAGHPLPDENSYRGTERAVSIVEPLTADDHVLFLLSGGGSSLFELSDLSVEELSDINAQLIGSGADIREINTVRKRLSRVKGGRFAHLCAPARVTGIILSDVIGDQVDAIASGPICPDSTTCADALAIIGRYNIRLSEQAAALLHVETPDRLGNVSFRICGSVRALCRAACEAAASLGYEPILLTERLSCTARDAGVFLANIAGTHSSKGRRKAFIAGGETVVNLTGSGKGGRNQEIALAASPLIAGLSNAAVFSVGSDGTDGPTDAAGGFADGRTFPLLKEKGILVNDALENNDAYNALQLCDGLIITNPTGTNVNDLSVALVQ